MRQLVTEGWMHRLSRQLTAWFFTRGQLGQRWEIGRDIFEKHLIDADWSINNANWRWISASFAVSECLKVYCPVNFFKQYDPEGSYIRKYVPELRKFPRRFIYSPWRAPLAIQVKARCVIGIGYPAPIVDHDNINHKNGRNMRDESNISSKSKTQANNYKSDKHRFEFRPKIKRPNSLQNNMGNNQKISIQKKLSFNKIQTVTEEEEEDSSFSKEEGHVLGKRQLLFVKGMSQKNTSGTSESLPKPEVL